MRLALALALALLAAAGDAPVAAQPAKAPSKAVEVFGQFRQLMLEGKYDLAAGYLDAFLAAGPSEGDMLKLEEKYGPAVFRGLRPVPKWSDDPATDKKARANVEKAVGLADAASKKLLQDPARVQKFVKNLGASYEEKIYAELELIRTGNYAVPFMVDAFLKNQDPKVGANVLGLIPKISQSAAGGWLAALDGMKPDEQYAVLFQLARRPDVLVELGAAQNDFTPVLWRIMGQTRKPGLEKDAGRQLAESLLNQITKGDSTKVNPDDALVDIGRTFYVRRATFDGTRTNTDGTPPTVPLWLWNAAGQKLDLPADIPLTNAEEYYGLRYARWALDLKPESAQAQELVLALAAERAVERGRFGDLSKTDPAVYALLAGAPAAALSDLLDRSLAQKKTALALALTQSLGDRGDKGGALTVPGRRSLYSQALEYPDPRVRLAAAVALLRSGVVLEGRDRGRVVEVLTQAVAADASAVQGPGGTALIADPVKIRADNTAGLLRSIGYQVEVYGSGRELLKRVGKASDFDLILVDRHIVSPELVDVVGQLRADLNASRRPLAVIASADQPKGPSLDQLLLRLALLVAATDPPDPKMPAPFVPNREATQDDNDAAREANAARRDAVIRTVAETRLTRLLRVVDSIGLDLTDTQKFNLKLRAEQITYAILGAEFPLNRQSAPGTVTFVSQLNKQIVVRPPSPAYVRRAGFDGLITRIERFEVEVMKEPAVLKQYDALRAGVDPDELGLDIQVPRDFAVEAKVGRTVKPYPGVAVIPEPYSRYSLQQDLKSAFPDPADAPRDPAEKAAGAKVAIEWLRKMAVGEVAGYAAKDIEPAQDALRAALRKDDLSLAAADALARIPSADAQQDLVALAATPVKPLPVRLKAADAAIRHVQAFGKLTTKPILDGLAEAISREANAEVKGKMQVLRGLLAYTPADYAAELKGYSPPLLPPKPMP